MKPWHPVTHMVSAKGIEKGSRAHLYILLVDFSTVPSEYIPKCNLLRKEEMTGNAKERLT